MTSMHKCEGYWVSGNGAERVDYFQTGRQGQGDRGFGSPGVRYKDLSGTPDRVLVTFGGHHSSGGPYPNLVMSVATAEVLVELLQAAITDARIANGEPLPPISYRDITSEPCTCAECVAEREWS